MAHVRESITAEAVEREHEKWSCPEKAWDIMHNSDEKVFFQTLKIAKDGGLHEIGDSALWYSSRPVSAAVLMLFVVYNVYYLVVTNIHLLQTASKRNAEDEEFLLTQEVFKTFSSFKVEHSRSLVATIELFGLAVLAIATIVQIILIKFSDGLRKWKSVTNLCWECLPLLSNFSAMKLIAYISPSKISVDLFDILFYRESGVAISLIIFIITRPLMVLIGVDCFLVKFRIASVFILEHDFSANYFLGAFLFLNQLLGAMNLPKELKNRLYRYVFGGEDGIITDEENNIQTVWEGMVAEKIYAVYPKWKASCLMLTWCDDDFQLLTLNQVNFKIGN
jgi:hypothetical protein|eukprot:TRINITY_DN196_c0_g1_i2.p1 TRINITY_DN196_c0_g1~~TRINITY_DN196_c0_g1_i2.p1  ORF type:complete len:361 (+),score=61.50 TRINITY_DN196_c0_g1_i2:80-1084(+)